MCERYPNLKIKYAYVEKRDMYISPPPPQVISEGGVLRSSQRKTVFSSLAILKCYNLTAFMQKCGISLLQYSQT